MSTMLEAELLAHLDTQIASAKRLLATILEQGAAIRARDVETVLGKLAEIQTEMGRRGRLEQERIALLQRAGQALGVGPAAVTLERMCTLITPAAAHSAHERSAELRGLLAEIAREHGINRALMRQELAFLVPPHPPRRRRARAGLQARRRRRGPARAAPPPRTASWICRPSHGRSPPSTASRRRCAACSPSSARSTRPRTTSPTPRRRGTRARRPSSPPSPATDIPAGMLWNGGGAQLGSGVDVQAYQRVRDNFLDLQYRGQNAVLGEQTARSEALDRVGADARRARRERHLQAPVGVLGRLVLARRRAERPGRPGRPAGQGRRPGRRLRLGEVPARARRRATPPPSTPT